MNLLEKAADILFPPKCIFCGKLTDDETVCPVCRDGLPLFRGLAARGEFFTKCAPALKYDGAVRGALLRFKFGGRRQYAPTLAEFVAEAASRELDVCDIISWPPVSEKRRRRRGYDQAELLARETARIMGLPAEPLLVKTRHTPPQSGINGRARRTANVLDAYKTAPGTEFSGKRILLVDDIVTTGATLSECARTLLMAGAAEVQCAAVARAD